MCHVLDHFFTPVVREVHVNIGHVGALRVKEAFKGQLVAQGINIGDAQCVGHQAAGCRAARGAANAARTRVVHKVPLDQEIWREAFLRDQVDLIVKLFLDLFGHLAKAFFGPIKTQGMQEVLLRAILRGNGIIGQLRLVR